MWLFRNCYLKSSVCSVISGNVLRSNNCALKFSVGYVSVAYSSLSRSSLPKSSIYLSGAFELGLQNMSVTSTLISSLLSYVFNSQIACFPVSFCCRSVLLSKDFSLFEFGDKKPYSSEFPLKRLGQPYKFCSRLEKDLSVEASMSSMFYCCCLWKSLMKSSSSFRPEEVLLRRGDLISSADPLDSRNPPYFEFG